MQVHYEAEVLQCTGKCCTKVTKAVGVLPGGKAATAFAEPAALTADWELKLGHYSSAHSVVGVLFCTFTGVLKNAFH